MFALGKEKTKATCRMEWPLSFGFLHISCHVALVKLILFLSVTSLILVSGFLRVSAVKLVLGVSAY
jgi:hypothetical protein